MQILTANLVFIWDFSKNQIDLNLNVNYAQNQLHMRMRKNRYTTSQRIQLF